ncbi:hypothetical protein COI_0186 [Mannheimia haemolytica serotype A2 str. OVINE]|nr:hypothetical protein COI_0186 [Mannheimia haemolytica serotype A2 str. OVINE]EEY11548.1 hypothetical protein COK_2382 [Mannheimia haemolytica serotype A2 str. BOVINE]
MLKPLLIKLSVALRTSLMFAALVPTFSSCSSVKSFTDSTALPSLPG